MNILRATDTSSILITVAEVKEGVLATVVDLIREIRDDSRAVSPPRIILHVPAVLFAADAASERRRHVGPLVELIADGSVAIWNAGYVAAPIDLLSREELILERAWGIQNRWKHGIADVLGSPGVRYFPFRVRLDQVGTLTGAGTPVCIGYPWGDPVDPSSARSRRNGEATQIDQLVLWDPEFTGGRWHTLRTRRLVAGSTDATVATGPFDLLHVVLPREIDLASTATTIREAVATVLSTDPEPAAPANPNEAITPSQQGVPMYGAGVTPYPIRREAVVLSALDSPSRDGLNEIETRPRICAAADRAISGHRIIPASESVRTEPSKDGNARLNDKELQGGSSGALTMHDGPFRARFLGGRLASVGGKRDKDEPVARAQGTALFRPTGGGSSIPTRACYLQTLLSAWFTGVATRGVHENASIDGIISVENEAVMREDVPGLLFGQTFTVAGEPPHDVEWVVPFEIAISPIADETDILITLITGDSIQSSEIRNWFSTWNTPRGLPPAERCVYANSVSITTPTETIRISAAVESPETAVPFRFAVVPKKGVPTLTFRTTRTILLESWPTERRWTVSYLFSIGDVTEPILGRDGLDTVPRFTIC